MNNLAYVHVKAVDNIGYWGCLRCLPLRDLQCGPALLHTPHLAGKTHLKCQLETGLEEKKGKKIVNGVQIYNFYVCCRRVLGENRWNSVSVSYLDLYNHSGWGWRTWWGTYSLAASVRAPGERRVLKAAKWKRWDRSQGEWAYSLFSNGHSPPSGSPPLTRRQAGEKNVKFTH